MAEALKVFLEHVIPVTKPWVSTQSIAAGSVWYPDLCKELGQSGFGLLCLTKGNVKHRGIAFEAGPSRIFTGRNGCAHTSWMLKYCNFNSWAFRIRCSRLYLPK